MSSEPTPRAVPHAARRSHRKSRTGCIHCKKRKVKCDEVKPICGNCVRFRTPCSLDPEPVSHIPIAEDAPASQHRDWERGRQRRGRGRPRNIWNDTLQEDILAESSSIKVSATPSCSLNVIDAELLLHFTALTANTLGEKAAGDRSLAKFWAQEIPQIGLSHHHVLHLCLALAGYHLARSSENPSSESRQKLIAAHSHYREGVSELITALSSLDETNQMAIFASAMLICFCRFAAGPSGPGDLAVCGVEGECQSWLPLIRGVRAMRETTDAEASLFNSTFGIEVNLSKVEDKVEDTILEGPRIDWEQQLAEFRSFIALSKSQDVHVYLQSLDALAEIYEATYGKSDGTCNVLPHNRFVIGWLYRMDDDFVACLERKEPLALLLLAYYSLLLRSMKNCWFMNGWCEHLLRGISEILCHDFAGWLQWPTKQAGLG